MLVYNLERIYKARGIEKPYAFFKSKGFSDSFAAKLNKGKVTGMKLSTLEKLCEMLNCTPHDLLEWEPDNGTVNSEAHPLQILHIENKPPDMSTLLKSVPLEKMKEIEKFIKDKS
ncbi:helix-turn-helix domain-containing protein [Bacteroidota bacterium]